MTTTEYNTSDKGATMNERAITDLDVLTKKYTAFESFEAMCNAVGGYVPTIRWDHGTTIRKTELAFLAGAYDGYQAARETGRKSYR